MVMLLGICSHIIGCEDWCMLVIINVYNDSEIVIYGYDVMFGGRGRWEFQQRMKGVLDVMVLCSEEGADGNSSRCQRRG